ncbi:MAG TPA: cation-efflux pump [Ruminococcaceae bacterium]|nr:cation-efflux pump [Oscillospiraceae bacterium]
MSQILIRLFIKDYRDTGNVKVRARYGILSGIVGIILNLILSGVKLLIGTLSNSISITADALNNLSDAGNSCISVLGFRMSSKPADEEHPYGHGRIEYLAGMGVSVVIMFMGFELIKSSVEKIIHPETPEFSWASVLVLLISIGGKVWLAFFNRAIGKRIHSGTINAVVMDSLSDVAATSFTILALFLSRRFSLPFDGIFGIVVAGFVFFAGFSVFRDTLAPLLGQPPTEEFVKTIEDKIMSYEGILGVHDLIVHDYGPNRCFISAHAEVSASTDIMESHDLMDVIERDIHTDLGLNITLHMDPIVTDDEKVTEAKQLAEEIIAEIDPNLSLHDFRMVSGPHHTNLIFDVVVPFSLKINDHELLEQINQKLSERKENYFSVITIDRSYR